MKIAIAEDSVVLRDGLCELLSSRGFDIVATVGDAAALARTLDGGIRPDVVVMDVRMPPSRTDEGIRAAVELRRTDPGIGILIFSQYIEVSYAARLFTGDVRGLGYLLKDRVSDVADFVSALQRIADGGTVLDPEVATALVAAAYNSSSLAGLTAREREVLALMAEGCSNTRIAERARLSLGGVEKNIASIFGKLNLEQAPELHRRVLAVLTYLEWTS
jgi:DNA-binding NarL/FixJ family response regulator